MRVVYVAIPKGLARLTARANVIKSVFFLNICETATILPITKTLM